MRALRVSGLASFMHDEKRETRLSYVRARTRKRVHHGTSERVHQRASVRDTSIWDAREPRLAPNGYTSLDVDGFMKEGLGVLTNLLKLRHRVTCAKYICRNLLLKLNILFATLAKSFFTRLYTFGKTSLCFGFGNCDA